MVQVLRSQNPPRPQPTSHLPLTSLGGLPTITLRWNDVEKSPRHTFVRRVQQQVVMGIRNVKSTDLCNSPIIKSTGALQMFVPRHAIKPTSFKNPHKLTWKPASLICLALQLDFIIALCPCVFPSNLSINDLIIHILRTP